MFHSPIEISFTQADADTIEGTIGRAAFAGDGTILRVNQRFLELYDYVGWDLVGRNRSILSPDTGEGSDLAARAIASGKSKTCDVRQLTRDGTTFWAEVLYAPIRDDAGEVAEVVMLVRDATARRMIAADEAGQIAAINQSQAVIHFAVDGTILSANRHFLDTIGYSLDEIAGRHHRMFVDPWEQNGSDYADFWDRLRAGHHSSGEFRRIAKDGRAVWLRATYTPILDLEGQPCKIVKYAVDITTEKQQEADFRGQIAAIDKSQCVATFAPDGTILDANARFLAAVGYTMEELEGRHHRIFVEPAHSHSLDYEVFWSDLACGHHRSGEFRRIAKDGAEVWFQSTYSPVLDQDGQPLKIVNHATAVTREKLRQADHQGQIAAIHRSQSVISFTIDGHILDANDNFLELMGYRLSQVRGRHHAMFVSAEERTSEDYAAFWRDLAAGNYRSGEFKRICHDGREVWLQASYNPIFDMSGRPFKVVKNAVDVTEQKLRQGDYEGQIAAIHKSQCVASFDLNGRILDANDNFLNAMGYQLAEVVGQHHRIFVDAKASEGEEYRHLWERLREGQHLSSKFRRIARDGSERWIQATYNPIYDLNGRPFKIVKIATDITADMSLAADLSRAQREVQHDAATGLPNRLGLRRFLRGALAATDSRLALLYLDLDHFKPINDTFGHDVGDYVLKTVAERLRQEIGDGQIAARIGGDEFVVAACAMARADVEQFAKRLIEAVSQPIRHGDRSLQVGLSVGVAMTPEDTLDEDELFRFADVALYRSKGTQRGSVTFYAEDYEASAEADRHLGHELRIGVKAGQFSLLCTPCHAEEDGVLAAAPTLVEVRPVWNHPTRGAVGPDVFLRVAEGSGLIVPLGDWMLREACRLARDWEGTTVSVPISPRQLLSSDVPGALALALRETGADPSRIVLRLEQGTTRVNAASLGQDIMRLRAMGTHVVAGSFLVGDALAAPEGWAADRIMVDARLRPLLIRNGNPLAKLILDRDAAGAAALPPGGERLYQVDREGELHAYVAYPPIAADVVAGVVVAAAAAAEKVAAAA